MGFHPLDSLYQYLPLNFVRRLKHVLYRGQYCFWHLKLSNFWKKFILATLDCGMLNVVVLCAACGPCLQPSLGP